VGATFFAHVQTGTGVHPAFCTMGTGSFPGVKRPGRDADHTPPSRVEVTKGESCTSIHLLGLSKPVQACPSLSRPVQACPSLSRPVTGLLFMLSTASPQETVHMWCESKRKSIRLFLWNMCIRTGLDKFSFAAQIQSPTSNKQWIREVVVWNSWSYGNLYRRLIEAIPLCM
jgi:hypothetical protein